MVILCQTKEEHDRIMALNAINLLGENPIIKKRENAIAPSWWGPEDVKEYHIVEDETMCQSALEYFENELMDAVIMAGNEFLSTNDAFSNYLHNIDDPSEKE